MENLINIHNSINIVAGNLFQSNNKIWRVGEILLGEQADTKPPIKKNLPSLFEVLQVFPTFATSSFERKNIS